MYDTAYRQLESIRLVEIFGYRSNEFGAGKLHFVLFRFPFDGVVISGASKSNPKVSVFLFS